MLENSLDEPEKQQTDPEQANEINVSNSYSDQSGPVVTFSKSGTSAVWDDSHPNLLEFAEANGLDVDFSCRAGICSTCTCNKGKGMIAYLVDPLDQPEEGQVLLCISKPVGDISIEI